MRRRSNGPGSQPNDQEERSANIAKAAWRRRISVVDPIVLNNHAPGGTFAKAKPSSDPRMWWCQHFASPILQLSGQSASIRREILERIWREGACFDLGEVDSNGVQEIPSCKELLL